MPPLEEIKGVGDDEPKRLRTDGSSNERPQRITQKSDESDHGIVNRASDER